MSITLIAWLLAFASLAVMALFRPALGFSLYALTFFACPSLWWWGEGTIGGYRWALYAGVICLTTTVLNWGWRDQLRDSSLARLIIGISVAILLNATVVHLLLAKSWTISSGPYTELAKFVLLFGMIVASVRDERDYRILMLSIVIGAAYIGYEVTINERGKLVGNRLEGVSVPSASSANGLACLMVTILPLTASLFLHGKWWERLIAIPAAPFIANVLVLCNSRGAFLAAIAGGCMFVLSAPSRVRRNAIKGACLGAVVIWMMLGDPRILERFMTTFTGSEERDHAASSRVDYWKAGLRMVVDYPLGAGGDGFHDAHGAKYIREVSGAEYESRSVHNGYINEACDWGLQGLTLRMMFLGGAIVLLWRVKNISNSNGDPFATICACGLIASLTGFMVQSFFGDFIDNEWGYWVAACAIAHAAVYSKHSASSLRQYIVVPAIPATHAGPALEPSAMGPFSQA